MDTSVAALARTDTTDTSATIALLDLATSDLPTDLASAMTEREGIGLPACVLFYPVGSSRPVHVSVFGSAARADGQVESDIDLLIVRPENLAEDDPHWREQLHRLAERIERWSGNHASLHEITLERIGTDAIKALGEDDLVAP